MVFSVFFLFFVFFYTNTSEEKAEDENKTSVKEVHTKDKLSFQILGASLLFKINFLLQFSPVDHPKNIHKE